MGFTNIVQPSSLSSRLTRSEAKNAVEALPHEILHNLQYQHGWTELQLGNNATTTTHGNDSSPRSTVEPSEPHRLILGRPPRHSYIHPDFLNHLVSNHLEESSIPIQKEWVLPLAIGEKCTLKMLSAIFDSLPTRDALTGASGFVHQDAKRILCAMKARDGFGGDGTIVYYIMQEGEVKPRQN